MYYGDSDSSMAGKLLLTKVGFTEPASPDKIYSTLDTAMHQIRVVKLHASENFESGVKAELFITSLHENATFKALSYTWGNANDTVSISLNGHPVAVTRNLEKALRHIRQQTEDLIIWI